MFVAEPLTSRGEAVVMSRTQVDTEEATSRAAAAAASGSEPCSGDVDPSQTNVCSSLIAMGETG